MLLDDNLTASFHSTSRSKADAIQILAAAFGYDRVSMNSFSESDLDRPALEALLRSYATTRNIAVEGEGDLVLLAANALAEQQWQCRSPKRPAWLDRRLHGTGPTRFT